MPVLQNNKPAVYATLSAAMIAGCYCLNNTIKPHIMRTRPAFHVSRAWNSWQYGGEFTFHQIAGDSIKDKPHDDGICVEFDDTGVLKAVYDGKETPLFLTSIPGKQSHIDQIKGFNKAAHTDVVGVYTLNEPWECYEAGLTDLAKTGNIVQYHYSTHDFTAPSFIDMLRGVRDLDNRDAHNYAAAALHCKAGRGRGPSLGAAYVAHVVNQAHKNVTVENIEAYLVTHRPQVKLAQEQKKALEHFAQELHQAGTFEQLYQKHKKAVETRDEEIREITGSLEASIQLADAQV